MSDNASAQPPTKAAAEPPARKRRGLYCPNCTGTRFTTTSRYAQKPGVRLKYIRCRSCQAKLTIREQIVAVSDPTPPADV